MLHLNQKLIQTIYIPCLKQRKKLFFISDAFFTALVLFKENNSTTGSRRFSCFVSIQRVAARHFQLATLLDAKLRSSEGARLVIVASESHRRVEEMGMRKVAVKNLQQRLASRVFSRVF